ncbi:MAG: ArsA-related P-loop ATPase [Bacteriovoracaceae bacterium]
MIRSIQNKQFEIFCGTGGVGKTTLATSRALFLAKSGKRVLLMTIDPAKRLKEILKMSDENAGTVENINYNNIKFDALLMSPKATFNRLRKSNPNNNSEKENRIIEILARPYGGMNEILAITEVRYHLSTNNYDTIILDTPTGKTLFRFLESCKKINDFFDKSFIDLFKYLGKSLNSNVKNEGGILDFLSVE